LESKARQAWTHAKVVKADNTMNMKSHTKRASMFMYHYAERPAEMRPTNDVNREAELNALPGVVSSGWFGAVIVVDRVPTIRMEQISTNIS
jgi:hypothetical protein